MRALAGGPSWGPVGDFVIPSMVRPSLGSTLAFVAIVLSLAALFVLATYASGTRRGDAPIQVRRDTLAAVVGVSLYLALTAILPASGLFARTGPPALMAFLATTMLVAVGLAFSPVGARFADGLPIVALVGFQIFRLPLELVLHRWWVQGVLPVQMTYEGRNFDVASGLLALALALWCLLRRPSPWLVLAFNVVGLGLLVNVATIAVTSAPGPLRTFTNEPPVLLGFHAPYAWIVPFCVGGALFGHLVTFRWLRRGAR